MWLVHLNSLIKRRLSAPFLFPFVPLSDKNLAPRASLTSYFRGQTDSKICQYEKSQ